MSYIRQFDSQVSEIVRILPARWRPVMRTMTLVGEPMVVIAVGLAGFLAASLRGQTAAQRAFIWAGVAYGLGILLKHLIRRARPNHLRIESFGMKSYSFPSGHAFGSIIFYGLFAVIDSRRLLFPWDLISSAVVWAAIFMIGISRIYLKSHYPSDVAGGWLFGGLALAIIVRLTL